MQQLYEEYMSKIANKINKIGFDYVIDLHNICQPLFQNSSINSFHYERIYKDGSYISLNTDLELENFITSENNKKYRHDVKIIDALFDNKDFYRSNRGNKLCFFTEDIDQGYWSNMFKKFRIKSCFNIIEENNFFYERFGFTSLLNAPSYGFYINNCEILEKFILYFKEYGSDLIKTNEKTKIIWLNNNPQYNKLVQNLKKSCNTKDKNLTTLEDKLKIKKYPLNNNHIKSYLTQHELKCLQHLGKGFTCKEIGNVLRISYRTVETHIRNIKNKLNIYSHDQLLKIYHSSRLSAL